MAEKNTLSILETIKKKMLKLDQKKEPSVETNSNAEFEYISSKIEVPAENKIVEKSAATPKPETVKPAMPKFEDSLGLDDAVAAPAVAEKSAPIGGTKSFDDFNLDDLDLDNESKISTPAANPPANLAASAALDLEANPFANQSVVATNHDPELEEEDAEEFEDEVDPDDQSESKTQNNEKEQDLDWLGNPIGAETEEEEEVTTKTTSSEKAVVDEFDLDHLPDFNEQPETAPVHETSLKKDELDLTDLGDLDLDEVKPEAPQVAATKELVQENDDLDFDLPEGDLSNKAAAVETHEIDEEHQIEEQEIAEEDLQTEESDAEDLMFDEEDEHNTVEAAEEEQVEEEQIEEEKIEEEQAEEEQAVEEFEEEFNEEEFLAETTKVEKAPQVNTVDKIVETPVVKAEEVKIETKTAAVDEDLNFDDLQFDGEDSHLAKTTPIESATTIAQPETIETKTEFMTAEQDIFADVAAPESTSEKAVSEKHEIDLEFEKDLMGFKAGASESIAVKPVVPAFTPPPAQNIPLQNNVEVMNKPNDLTGDYKASDTTIRQVSHSVKKLIDAKNVVSGIASFSQSPALAELALHLMEPKIEKWFNDNLPELVEKVVREEIKKMIPKD